MKRRRGKSQHIDHADARLEQRCGIQLSWAERLELQNILAAGRGKLVRVDVAIYDVEISGKQLRVVFDHRSKRIPTVLTPPSSSSSAAAPAPTVSEPSCLCEIDFKPGELLNCCRKCEHVGKYIVRLGLERHARVAQLPLMPLHEEQPREWATTFRRCGYIIVGILIAAVFLTLAILDPVGDRKAASKFSTGATLASDPGALRVQVQDKSATRNRTAGPGADDKSR